jgi:hypothetical protein
MPEVSGHSQTFNPMLTRGPAGAGAGTLRLQHRTWHGSDGILRWAWNTHQWQLEMATMSQLLQAGAVILTMSAAVSDCWHHHKGGSIMLVTKGAAPSCMQQHLPVAEQAEVLAYRYKQRPRHCRTGHGSSKWVLALQGVC